METRTPGRRGKRLIKPFCLSTITAATTATSPVCILSKYRQICEVFLLRFGKMAGHKILGFQPQAPSTHICFSSQSQICPLLRISFCPGGTFWTFFGRICCSAKSSYSSRQSFPMAAQARMLHNAVVGAVSSFQQWCGYFISQTRDGWYMFFSRKFFLQLFLARYLIQWISYRNTCPYESTFLHGAFLYEQRHRQRRKRIMWNQIND